MGQIYFFYDKWWIHRTPFPGSMPLDCEVDCLSHREEGNLLRPPAERKTANRSGGGRTHSLCLRHRGLLLQPLPSLRRKTDCRSRRSQKHWRTCFDEWIWDFGGGWRIGLPLHHNEKVLPCTLDVQPKTGSCKSYGLIIRIILFYYLLWVFNR